MIKPSVTLAFSETHNQFDYVYLDPIKPTFKLIVEDIGITEAIRFVEWIRGVFPHPLSLVSVIAQYNVFRIKLVNNSDLGNQCEK